MESRVKKGPVIAESAALLGGHVMFRELGAEIHDRLSAYAKLKNVKRGATIFSKGDAGTCLFAVRSGVVRVASLSANGKNAVFNLLKEGEIFGEIALLDGKPRTADAMAFSDCVLLVIERRDFLSLLRQFPEVSISLLEMLCARLRRTTEQVEDLMFLDLRSRLVKTVLHLSRMEPGGEIMITQDDLSQIVGMSREMINKQLQVWAKIGWIQLARKRISVLQPEALARIVAED